VLGCDVIADAVIVEVRAETALLAVALADVELQRFHGYRRTTLLTPLDAQTSATVASAGLSEPDLDPRRILEMLIADAHL
jgi:hypothetical protein